MRSPSEILDERELKRIAAASQRKTLIAWLQAKKIPYIEAASGWPRVHMRALEAALGVGQVVETIGPESGSKINLENVK